MNEIELAYVAGIVDGEGWVGYANPGPGKGRPRPQIEVESTDPELIEYLRVTVPGSYTPKMRPARTERHRPIYRWRIGGTACRELAKRLHTHLRINRKRETVEKFRRW